jgi:hypothetical protein
MENMMRRNFSRIFLPTAMARHIQLCQLYTYRHRWSSGRIHASRVRIPNMKFLVDEATMSGGRVRPAASLLLQRWVRAALGPIARQKPTSVKKNRLNSQNLFIVCHLSHSIISIYDQMKIRIYVNYLLTRKKLLMPVL